MPGTNRVPFAPARSGHRAAGRTAIRWYRGALAALGTALSVAVLLGAGQPALAQTMHTLPFVTPASNTAQRTLVRIVNRSTRGGTVTIRAIDDNGQRRGPVRLQMGARQTRHITSQQLESGGGLVGGRGVGNGTGNWRLELETTLDIAPLAYIWGAAGFITTMHDTVRSESMRHHVLTFNKAPASGSWSRAELRVTNPSESRASVTITGRDDAGRAGAGTVRFSLAPRASRILTVHQLERGHGSFQGRLGTQGRGRWQLFVAGNRPIRVMNLMRSPSTGYMTNLSSMKEADVIRGSAGGDELWGTSGDDIIDPGDNATSRDPAADRGFDTVHGSRGDDMIIYAHSGEEAFQELRYSDPDGGEYLSARITATIDGAADTATVDKGSAGTDTIVNVARPLNAAGVGLVGTRFADVFNLTVDDGQFMNVMGGAGRDRFDVELIDDGRLLVDYEDAPRGINVDLARNSGQVRNDGHGNVDTFTGDIPQGIAGSRFRDVIRGSDRDESFIGRGGNDRIDGRGGLDELRFDAGDPRFAGRLDIGDVEVDLGAGTATGSWNGVAFAYFISNVEVVHGGPGNDTLEGGDGTSELYGGAGNDVLIPGSTDWRIDPDAYGWVGGSTGNDRIVYTDSGPRAWQGIAYHYLAPGIGITARIDGGDNQATVRKGSSGTDTVVDIVNPLRSGFGLRGSHSDDVFHLAIPEGQGLNVRGNAGDDVFNLRSSRGWIELDFRNAPGGIDVDLRAGRVNDDGHGDADTINGSPGGVRGTKHADTIRGSGNDEGFRGQGGDDVIDGGGGYDRLDFGGSDDAALFVDMEEGRAVGSWNGRLFNLTFSNIEQVSGGPFFNTLVGSDGDDTFAGTHGFDLIAPNGGNDTIFSFPDGDDVIWLDSDLVEDFGLTHADVIDAARQDDEDVLIDLTMYGMGTIRLKYFNVDWLDIDNIRL